MNIFFLLLLVNKTKLHFLLDWLKEFVLSRVNSLLTTKEVFSGLVRVMKNTNICVACFSNIFTFQGLNKVYIVEGAFLRCDVDESVEGAAATSRITFCAGRGR